VRTNPEERIINHAFIRSEELVAARFNPDKWAAKLGYELERVDLLPPPFNGNLLGTTIYLRKEIEVVDQLIAIAEQDCHYLFHPRKLSLSFPSKVRKQYEQEASKYAAIILAPTLGLYSTLTEFWIGSYLPRWYKALRIIIGDLM